MSSAAHPHGHGNAHLPLASQTDSPATPAYPAISEDIYREAQRNMMATLNRVRQDDMRNFRDTHILNRAPLEQEQMECTQQFFQLQNEMTDLTKEQMAVDAEMVKLEELLKQARQKKQEVAGKISTTQLKFNDVQAFQRLKHAELQALTRKHEKELKDKEKMWEQLYQQRLSLMQSKIPSSAQHAQNQNAMAPDQAETDTTETDTTETDTTAAASLPMHSLRAPQLGPSLSHQSAGQSGLFLGGPVQPPALKAPTDNGPRESPGLPVTKRPGASVLEAPALTRTNSIESQRTQGTFRPPTVQKSPILQAPVGYQAPFPQPQSSSDAFVPVLPTVVPSVESPDEQTPIPEIQGVTTPQLTHNKADALEQDGAPPTTSAATNGATDCSLTLKTPKEAAGTNDTVAEAADAQGTMPGAAAASASEDQETEDMGMADTNPPGTTTETANVLGTENGQSTDMEMADNQVVEKQPENSPATPVVADATAKLRVDPSKAAEAGPQAAADTADSPLSDLSSIPSPTSDTFTRAGSPSGQPPSVVDDRLCVYDEDGKLVGEVRRLTHTTSPNIEKIAAVPIKRHVQIRSGRKFTSEDLDRIYHVSDVKGTKWTSCYIQATGEVQTQPCNTCAKHNGPYEECIILDAADSFPKCGNCEWNRHACVGASLRPKTVLAAAAAPEPAPTMTSKPSLGSSFTAVNSPSVDPQDNASPRDVADFAHNQDAPPIKKPGRKSLPTSRVKLPSQPVTPRAASPEPATPGGEPLPEITRENLCLRDDGTVYTAPPFMAGVPLAKISPNHPYWENYWDPDIASHIRSDLEKWTARFQEMDSQGVKDHRKYEAQRQINRGQLTLKFLEEGELHPYQLVGKAWMEPKKLIKYNTLYRLASTLMEDLPKFGLGVTPAEWMRHRLCEIYQEHGSNFNLASTVANFYHDPKHAQVRTKNGFVSVGRPHKSAGKPKIQPGQDDGTPKQGPKILKRKELHATPKAAAGLPKQEDAAPESQQHQQQQPSEPPRPRSSPRKLSGVDQKTRPRSRSGNLPPVDLVDPDDEDKPIRAAIATPQPQPKKKIRVTSTVDPSTTPDLHYQGFTDVDSCSEDRLERIDWRVNQIKTAQVSTNPGVTQYWHWVDDHDPGFCEHQVLKQLRPPKWAVFKEPYNFHLKIAECDEIVYGPGSLRVIIRRKQHLQPKNGDMLAEFKRDRTKKRFLEFMHQKGIRIVRSNKEYVESAWENLKPSFDMPGQDRDSD